MPYFLIIFAVLVYGLYPSALKQFVTSKIDILSYLLAFQFIAALSQIFFAFVYSRARLAPLRAKEGRSLVVILTTRQTTQNALINAIFNSLAFGCFFFALAYGDASIATVFFELWASVFLVLTMVFRRGQLGQYQHWQGKGTSGVFFLLGAIGVLMIVWSQQMSAVEPSQVFLPDFIRTGGNVYVLSLIAAILAPIFMATSFMFGTRNARVMAAEIRRVIPDDAQNGDGKPSHRIDLLAGIYHGVFLRVFATGILSVVLLGAYLAGVWSPQIPTMTPAIFGGIVLTAMIASSGSTLANIANNLSSVSNLNLFWNFTPFIAILFLNFFGFLDYTPKAVFAGAILILSANYILSVNHAFSNSFLLTIFGLCVVYLCLIFLPPLALTEGIGHVSIPLGVFGIFAAFFVDRMVRGFDTALDHDTAVPQQQHRPNPKNQHYVHSIFTLWILGFGSIVGMILFRPENNMASDFVAAFVSVAVIYICLLPIDLLRSRGGDGSDDEEDIAPVKASDIWSIVGAAIFIAMLFVLYVLALLADTI